MPETKNFSISIPPELVERSKARAARLGFKFSWSAYVAYLLQKDLGEVPEIIPAESRNIVYNETPAPYRAAEPPKAPKKQKKPDPEAN